MRADVCLLDGKVPRNVTRVSQHKRLINEKTRLISQKFILKN